MNNETMSDETRRALVSILDQLMQAHPEWRIGQLVANIAFLAHQTNTATWDVENEEFIQTARQHLQRMAERGQAAAAAKQEIAATRQKVAA